MGVLSRRSLPALLRLNVLIEDGRSKFRKSNFGVQFFNKLLNQAETAFNDSRKRTTAAPVSSIEIFRTERKNPHFRLHKD